MTPRPCPNHPSCGHALTDDGCVEVANVADLYEAAVLAPTEEPDEDADPLDAAMATW